MKKNLKIIIPSVVLVIVAIVSIILILEDKNQEQLKTPVTTTVKTTKEETTLAESTEVESSTEATDSTTAVTTTKTPTTTFVTNIPVTQTPVPVPIPATQASPTQAPATQPPVTQAPPTTQAPITQAPVDYKMAVLELVNKERANAGLAPLSYYYEGQSVGDIRASEIGSSFSHTRPNGTQCFTVAEEAGITYMAAGENIASGYSTPEAVMNGWMNSPGHRANILDPQFTHIVVGRNGSNWVQFFFGF